MSNEIDHELGKPENWDLTRPEVRKPVKTLRIVVSVAFRRDEFILVSECAERIGRKTSEFIREAAIQKASGQGVGTLAYGSGSAGTSWWIGEMPATTQALGLELEEPGKTPAITY